MIMSLIFIQSVSFCSDQAEQKVNNIVDNAAVWAFMQRVTTYMNARTLRDADFSRQHPELKNQKDMAFYRFNVPKIDPNQASTITQVTLEENEKRQTFIGSKESLYQGVIPFLEKNSEGHPANSQVIIDTLFSDDSFVKFEMWPGSSSEAYIKVTYPHSTDKSWKKIIENITYY